VNGARLAHWKASRNIVKSGSPHTNIAAICAAMALFIVNDAFVKIAAADWPPAQIMAVRGVVAVLIMAAICIHAGDLSRWRSMFQPLVTLRCTLEGFIAFTYISALAVLPIADVTAILLIAPLLITAAGALFLGETVGWRRWLAVITGFVNPTGEGLGAAGLIAILSTIGVASRDLVTRRIASDVPTNIIALGTTLATTVTGFALSLATPWQPLAARPVALAFGAALLVALGNLAIVAAFRNVEVSIVSPFRYTIIVWAILIGMLAFGERPGLVTWTGIALIVGAGLYTIYRETVLARRNR
jgi:drug/metabolite transporter (DMT)-like permease